MELHVNAINGKNLPPVQKRDVPDPYLKLTLVDKHNKKVETIEEKTTNFIDNNTNPEWNEKFTFGIRSLESNYLLVTVMDHDKGNKDDVMAEFEIPLEPLALGEILEIKQKLPKPKKAKHSPMVNLNLFICKKGMEPWVPAPFKADVLNLTVVEAKDLPKVDTFGKIDAYITMNWQTSSKKYKTEVVEKNFEPHWNADFKIPITNPASDVLNLYLKDYDKMSKNDAISEYSIKVSELTPGQEIDKWVDFTPTGNKKGGQVHLKYKLESAEPPAPAEEKKEKKEKKHSHKHKSSKKSATEENQAAEVVEKIVEAVPEEPKEEAKPEPSQMVVNFKIVEAKELEAADLDGNSDPYCKFTYGKQEGKTETIKDTRSPKWDFVGKVDVNEEDEVLRFEPFDYDFAGKHDSLGYVDFKIKTLIAGQVVDRWYPLVGKKGQIHLVLHYCDAKDTPFEGQTLPAPADKEYTYEYYYVDDHSYSFSSHSDASDLSSWSTSDEKADSLSDLKREKRKRKVLKQGGSKPKPEKKDFKGFTLHMKIIEAKNVPAADGNGKSDPYVKFVMNGQEFKTKAIQNTLTPQWNEVFQLSLLDRNSDSIRFSIWDEDVKYDDELAHLKFHIKDLKPGLLYDNWIPMKNIKKEKLETLIHLVFHLAEIGDTPFEEKPIQMPVLNVKVIEAADVPKADTFGKTDPFCKLAFKGGKAILKTKVQDGTYTPRWNENFVLYPNNPKTDIFVIQLWDHDVSNDDLISAVQIPIGKFEEGKVVDDWWTLEPTKEFKEGGRVHLQIQIADEKKKAFE